MVEESHKAKTVPGARLVRILRDYFLKGSLRGTGVLFGDAALPFRKGGDGVGVIRDGTGRSGSAPASDLDRKSTRLNSSHLKLSRMPSSA